MSEQTEFLANALQTNGYRLTASRQAIIDKLASSGGHMTADDLAQQVRHDNPHVGRMTVYRTLELLSELGVIRPIYQGTGAAHFVLMAQGNHHHFICNRCHEVIEFDECTADTLTQQLAQQIQFQVQGHLLEVHGLCVGCQ